MNPHPAVRVLLWPAAVLFGAVVRLRAFLYRRGLLHQKRLNGAVISVGNLTVGGTGKTPMVIWLAERLLAQGKRVAVLTRGYRGQDDESDEVRVLRKRLGERVRIGVGANRYAVGKALQGQVDCFVLDDGFQHLPLARDLDIVLIDASAPFAGGKLLPAGRLREPRSALARAGVVIITRSRHAPAVESAVRRYSAGPIFYAQTVPANVVDLVWKEGSPDISDWAGKKCFAFCAIGNPAAFFDDLRRWGVKLVGTAEFPDHHRFTQREREQIERQARATGADLLICTEKDLYNLDDTQESMPLFPCAITLTVSDAEGLLREIAAAFQKRGEGAA